MVEGAPPLRVVDDALYVPHSPDGFWGLISGGVQHAAEAPEPPADAAVLPPPAEPSGETYLYLGLMVEHYGHFVCDVLAWAWPLLGRRGPRPRLLCHSERPRAEWETLDFLRTTLGGLGYAPADLVTFDRPTRLRQVIVGPPAFQTDRAWTVFGDLCRRIGEPIWRGAAVDSVERPVYLSKSRLRSGVVRMVNEPALEEELARRGVDIVYPEELPFAEQVRLFATRRLVMGTAGSALHSSIFAPPGRRILALHWEERLRSTFALLDRLGGTEARYYIPSGTRLSPEEQGFGFGWMLDRPARVADEMLARAARFDGLDQDDAADEAGRARLLNRLASSASTRAHRWLRSLRQPSGS